MKKYILSLSLCVILFFGAKAQLYSTLAGNVSFFSVTPVENIEGRSQKALAVMSTEKREMAFSIPNTSFQFRNKLMEEHFNEKYMESEKYPNSTFKGKINESVDLTKDGDYPVTVTGKLNVHGVEKERTIGGNIIVKEGKLNLKSEFKVLLKDHNIEIPNLVMAKIAEEISVTVDAVLLQKK